jgi:RNase adapter protein RapZ
MPTQDHSSQPNAPTAPRTRLLLVTGLSGAGKSSALKVLEDIGYEVVDNLPIALLSRLLALPSDSPDQTLQKPLAIGIDTRTRAFDAQDLVVRLKNLRRQQQRYDIRMVYFDCTGEALIRRFSETRRRHPLAQDRPIKDGIAKEREILEPLRRWADHLFDTTDFSIHQLKHMLIEVFGLEKHQNLTLTLMSFGFARGVPRDADLLFDMRFLANPHWVEALRHKTGKDPAVGAYVAADSSFAPAFERIRELVVLLLPSYRREGKAYLTIAFGCTGGKHRSVYAAETMAKALHGLGYDLTIVHRDLSSQAGELDQLALESIRG